MTRSAFIAIIGKPNVGKSSILNRLTGSKIAIVSSKPQTTRTKIMGVLTRDEVQLVFTDTPGFHHAHNKLGEHMNQAVGDTVGGVDACLFVVEPKGELNDKEQELLAMCKKQRLPVILAINKIDMLRDKTELAPRIGQLAGLYDFTAVVPCSAQTGEGMQDLLTEMERLALPSPHFFPDDTLTDQPERVLAAEMIREKILRPKIQQVYGNTQMQFPRRKLTGLQRLYYSYLYQMGVFPKKPKRIPYAVRSDIRRLEKRISQMEFLQKEEITTREELAAYRKPLEEQVLSLMKERRELYRKEPGGMRIQEINGELKELRKKIRLSQQIEKQSLEMEERLRQAKEQEEVQEMSGKQRREAEWNR